MTSTDFFDVISTGGLPMADPFFNVISTGGLPIANRFSNIISTKAEKSIKTAN